MGHKVSDFLKDIYKVPEKKITFIHHGIPDILFIDSSFYKDKFGVVGKKVLLTFGLLSPKKGIENVLQALPEVIQKHPGVVYIILGATHPHILKSHGDVMKMRLDTLSLFSVDIYTVFNLLTQSESLRVASIPPKKPGKIAVMFFQKIVHNF